MKVALIVQRYGAEIAGGSEQLCRMVAERLAKHCSCDVITTCARDYVTWHNEFPAGTTMINGVRVHRFPVDERRDNDHFNALSVEVFANPEDRRLQEKWMKAQGPYSTPMLTFLNTHSHNYDAFIFFTYLYCTTYFGLPLVHDRSILVPTAHDEPPVYLSMFDELFRLPQRLLFLTPEEQDFVYRRFCLPPDSGELASIGLENDRNSQASDIPEQIRSWLGPAPYLLYVGRIDESKGCKTLIEWFQKYASAHPNSGLRLVLAGKAVMNIPPHDRILAPGYVSESAKHALVEHAVCTVAPSPYESLCISALESWIKGTPVIANGHCEVLAGQCRRSNGGLWYRNYEEFAECVSLISANETLRRRLGSQGRDYVTKVYDWKRIEKIYIRNVQLVSGTAAIARASSSLA